MFRQSPKGNLSPWPEETRVTFPRPLPRPYPPIQENKRVTIAAGFRCNAGIVMCADTEETLGDIKQWMGKIQITAYPERGHLIAFAGAGWTDYIHTAIERASDGLSECGNLREIRNHLDEKLRDFFDKHLANWAYFSAFERPTVELLIGVSTKAGPFDLFYYGGTAFYSTTQKTIGSGAIIANNFISDYRTHNESLDQLCLMSVLMLSKVKKQVAGCGGDSHLVVIGAGADFALPEDADLRKTEAKLAETLRVHNLSLKGSVDVCGPLRLTWMAKEADKELSDRSDDST